MNSAEQKWFSIILSCFYLVMFPTSKLCFVLMHKEGIEKAMLISSFIRDICRKCIFKIKNKTKLVVQKCHIKKRGNLSAKRANFFLVCGHYNFLIYPTLMNSCYCFSRKYFILLVFPYNLQ